MLFCPSGIQIFLALLCRCPASRHGLLRKQLCVASAVVLLGRRHQGGINDLAATSDKTFFKQLARDRIQQRLRASVANAVLECPHVRADLEY